MHYIDVLEMRTLQAQHRPLPVSARFSAYAYLSLMVAANGVAVRDGSM